MYQRLRLLHYLAKRYLHLFTNIQGLLNKFKFVNIPLSKIIRFPKKKNKIGLFYCLLE